jgi:Holliday junction resolvasome RuvABC ATP-dependent DNA helicase subunit
MLLKDYVGQEEAKRKINFYLDAYKAGEAMPNFLFAGCRGSGKTSLSEALGLEVKKLSEDKVKVLLLNCASLKNMNSFWNSVVLPHVADKDVFLILDEVHKMPTDIFTAFLTIINPNPHSKTSYTHDDYTVDFDLRRQSFVFATTNCEKVPLPLLNRTRRLQLTDYTHNDLAKIVKMNAPEVAFKDSVMDHITPVLRANARTASLMSKDIKTYLAPAHKSYFNLNDWNSLSKTLDILPLGLTRAELKVLQILKERREMSLTGLASVMGFSATALRSDIELFPLSQNLITIGIGSKRSLAPAGQMYLRALESRK